MGCCTQRNNTKREGQYLNLSFIDSESVTASKWTLPSSSTNPDLSENYLFEYNNQDKKIQNIIHFCNISKNLNTWSFYMNEEDTQISMKTGSIFNPVIRIVRSTWTYKEEIPLNLILNLLLDPISRTRWDKSISEMNTISVESETKLVQRTLIKASLITREIIEEKIISSSKKEVIISSESVDWIGSEYTQAEVIFCNMKIWNEEGKFNIEVFSQVDLKLPWGAANDKTLGFLASKWLEYFKSAVYFIN